MGNPYNWRGGGPFLRALCPKGVAVREVIHAALPGLLPPAPWGRAAKQPFRRWLTCQISPPSDPTSAGTADYSWSSRRSPRPREAQWLALGNAQAVRGGMAQNPGLPRQTPALLPPGPPASILEVCREGFLSKIPLKYPSTRPCRSESQLRPQCLAQQVFHQRVFNTFILAYGQLFQNQDSAGNILVLGVRGVFPQAVGTALDSQEDTQGRGSLESGGCPQGRWK